MTIQEMREKRVALIEQARKIRDAAEKDQRKLTAEDEQQFDKAMADADQLKAQIDAEERDSQRQEWLSESLDEIRQAEQRRTQPEHAGRATVPTETPEDNRDGLVIGDYFEQRGFSAERLGAYRDVATRRYADAFERFLRTGDRSGVIESRDLEMGSDVDGGAFVAPVQFTGRLIETLFDNVFMRRLASVDVVNGAQSLGIVTIDSDPDDPVWTSEIGTGSDDTGMKTGSRNFTPHPLAKRIKVSNTLLRRSTMPVEQIVQRRLAYKFAVVEETAFLTGNGVGQPLGIFTDHADGLDSDREESSGNTTTAIKADGLMSAFYALKAQYRPRAQWVMHRTAIADIRKLKDGEGQYLWRAGLEMGQPDTLLGRPVNESEYAPDKSTGWTTGTRFAVLGDFSYYSIVDALTMTVQRLNELYAESNQTGYIGRKETDGQPTLAEAFIACATA